MILARDHSFDMGQFSLIAITILLCVIAFSLSFMLERRKNIKLPLMICSVSAKVISGFIAFILLLIGGINLAFQPTTSDVERKSFYVNYENFKETVPQADSYLARVIDPENESKFIIETYDDEVFEMFKDEPTEKVFDQRLAEFVLSKEEPFEYLSLEDQVRVLSERLEATNKKLRELS